MRARFAAVAAVAACLALGVAGGSAAAGLLTGADVKDGTVTGKDVKDGALKGGDFGAGTRGPRGDAGPVGATGAPAGDKGGYSWVFRANAASLPAMSSGVEYFVTCPVGSTVLGGGYYNDAALDLLDSSKVPGQEAWRIFLGNASGNATQHPFIYAWCAGLTQPAPVFS
jgi:hypothetical protein